MIDAKRNIGLVTIVDPAERPLGGAIIQDAYDLHCPWHHHDVHQLQYAFEGSIELEDTHGRHLLPRSLAGWIPAGVTHRDSMHRVRSLSLLLSPRLIAGVGERIRIIHVPPLMRAMLEEAVRWPLNQPQDATGRAFFAAFGKLCEEWLLKEAPFTLPTSDDPALTKAMAHTRAHLAHGTLTDASRASGFSERSLRRRFKSILGIGWDNYRCRARLMAAAEMLADSNEPIAQIAANVGFESQSAFAAAFRRMMGETPRVFRDSARIR